MTPSSPKLDRPHARLFAPILAGATARDRLLACLGAFAGIALVGLVGALARGHAAQLPWIVAPMGASAVLLFAVPASPMAQPWPIIGGNVLSAAVGLVVAHFVHDRTIAVGLAVGLAIGLMSLTRSLHPPGGAAALTAALGGPAVASAGFLFPLAPVGLNAVALVAVGLVFHKLSGHSYPHVAAAPKAAPPPVDLRGEDLDAVLAKLGEAFDIGREDLVALLREVEARSLARGRIELDPPRDVGRVDRP